MMDMTTSVSALEKLNNNNYSTWSTRMQFYLLGQELWEIVGGSESTPPTNEDDLKRWKVKAGKAMYALSISVEDDLLQQIKDAKTPKDAWDTLAGIFARTNDAKLQQLENELLSTSQGNMTVSEYFTKIKSLCQEISKLDPQNKITETRMRRIIIHGLRPEFNALVTATRGWSKEPTLNEIENILANQEALNNQISKVSIKKKKKPFIAIERARIHVLQNQQIEECQSENFGINNNEEEAGNEGEFNTKAITIQ